MAPQVGHISKILKNLKIDYFQSYFSYKKNYPGMKQINFSGTLVRVDCKTTPNYLNREKNYRLVLHSILGVFRKTPKIE